MKTLLITSAITAAFCAGKIHERINNQKDYQLNVDQKGVTVYDNNRIVGFITAGNTPLDSLVINDNL